MGSRGREHVEILQLVAQSYYGTTNTNHAIPLLDLIDFEDVTFGVFPRIGFPCRDLTSSMFMNSVGDIVDVLLQCIEVCHLFFAIGDLMIDPFT